MTNKKCDEDCCEHFFDDYNEDEDDYEIQRLKDIIRICEFLIQKKQHSKHKKEDLESFLHEMTKDQKNSEKNQKDSKPYTIYTYKYPYPRGWTVPWWSAWF